MSNWTGICIALFCVVMALIAYLRRMEKRAEEKEQRDKEREGQIIDYIDDCVEFQAQLVREQLMRDVAKMEVQ